MVRLQKYLAACGVASRRASEKLIVDGRVAVDGETITVLGTKIDPDSQRITCDRKLVLLKQKIWLMLNKPPGVICTSIDPEKRERVIDLLPEVSGRVYTVGRLDVMSEGLILVTNDGELAHRLMHPRYHIEKKYHVWIDRPLTPKEMDQILKGIHCRGEKLKALRIKPLRCLIASQPGYTLTLGEGRNRHIRRMMDALDCRIIRLLRVSVGPLRLEKLRTGEHRMLDSWEVDKLRNAVA